MRGAGAVALAVLLLAPLASADWLQDGGDAGRTGYLRDGGPVLNEVALVIAPPEGEEWHRKVPPLAFGREVIAMTDRSIVAVDIDTEEFRVIAERPPGSASETFERPTSAWAIVGRDIYLTEERQGFRGNACQAAAPTVESCADVVSRSRVIPMDGGSETELPLSDAGSPTGCHLAAAVNGTALFTACTIDSLEGIAGGAAEPIELRRLGVDQSVAWTWRKEADPTAIVAPLVQANAHSPALREIVGLSVVGRLVIVIVITYTAQGAATPTGSYWDGWIVDAETGTLVGTLEAYGTDGHFGSYSDACLAPGSPDIEPPSWAIGDEIGWVHKERESCSADPTERAPLKLLIASTDPGAQLDVRRIQLRGAESGVGSALTPERIYVATDTAIAAVTREGAPIWDRDLPTGRTTIALPMFVDPARVYAFVTSDPGAPTSLAAWRASDGAPLWEHAFDGTVTTVGAITGGIVAVVSGADGGAQLVVLGRAAGSIPLEAVASKTYPAAGELVQVDLSNARPGLHGPPTRYRADWGDGTSTMWQDLPILEHGYSTVGDHTARVYAGNDAGQVSSQAIEFHVGRTPPQNFLQSQFSSENQERTFFVLGLFITGAFAAFGVWRVQRRRGLLAQELAAAESAALEAKGDAVALDRALDERRFRARSLLLDSRLDEGQHAVLATRIEELSRVGRLDLAERSLDFLPYRHVRALREMLRDGRVSSLERAHFLRLLDEDETLVEEYKMRVRRVVEEWARHDGGAGGVAR